MFSSHLSPEKVACPFYVSVQIWVLEIRCFKVFALEFPAVSTPTMMGLKRSLHTTLMELNQNGCEVITNKLPDVGDALCFYMNLVDSAPHHVCIMYILCVSIQS